MKYEQGQAPRVTGEMISKAIARVEYIYPYETPQGPGRKAHGADESKSLLAGHHVGRVTFCILVFEFGAVVTGESIVAAGANYDAEKGQKAAYESAFNKARQMFGFHLAANMGSITKYIDKEGVTRDADGEESFMQFANSHRGRAELLESLANESFKGETDVVKHDEWPVQRGAPQVASITHASEADADKPVTPEEEEAFRSFAFDRPFFRAGERIDDAALANAKPHGQLYDEHDPRN